jgi:hypothetical protein
LATPPHTVYLSPEHYRYRLDESEGGNLILQLRPMETNWGKLGAHTIWVPLTPLLLSTFQLLQNEQDPLEHLHVEDGTLEREIRRKVTPSLQIIGLKQFAYTKQKRLRLVPIPRDDQLR